MTAIVSATHRRLFSRDTKMPPALFTSVDDGAVQNVSRALNADSWWSLVKLAYVCNEVWYTFKTLSLPAEKTYRQNRLHQQRRDLCAISRVSVTHRETYLVIIYVQLYTTSRCMYNMISRLSMFGRRALSVADLSVRSSWPDILPDADWHRQRQPQTFLRRTCFQRNDDAL